MDVPAAIDEIPIFIKEGAILPMGPYNRYETESVDPIELRIYPGANGNFTLYEDENDNYEKGIYFLIKFNWEDRKKILTMMDRKVSFPGMLKERTFKIVLVDIKKGTGVEISGIPDKVFLYEGKKLIIKFSD